MEHPHSIDSVQGLAIPIVVCGLMLLEVICDISNVILATPQTLKYIEIGLRSLTACLCPSGITMYVFILEYVKHHSEYNLDNI